MSQTPPTNELPKFSTTSDDASFDWKNWFENIRKNLVEDTKQYKPSVDSSNLFDGIFDDNDDFEEISLKHEEYRTYIYGNGVELTIHEPTWLIIDKEDPTKHIVEDATAVYEVTPGWIAIKKGY